MMHTQRIGALFHFINIQMEITLNWQFLKPVSKKFNVGV